MMVSEPSEPPENTVTKLLTTIAKSEENGTIFLNIFGSFKFLNILFMLFISGPFAFLKEMFLMLSKKIRVIINIILMDFLQCSVWMLMTNSQMYVYIIGKYIQ